MKTACTAFILTLLLTSCAKKFKTQDSSNDNSRYFAKTDYTLATSSQTAKSITFSKEQDFIIPNSISLLDGELTDQSAKIYFDYSNKTEQYAYYCRYFPSENLDSLVFDNCFSNEAAEVQYDSIPNSGTQLVFYPGYSDLVHSGNSIVLEVNTATSSSDITVEVQLEIN